MTTLAARASLIDELAALLRGELVAWSDLGITSEQFLAALDEEDLTGLVHAALEDAAAPDWPAELRVELGQRARGAVATELLRQRETATVLDALSARGIEPILLKGTPLAYAIYRAPGLRPRSDTDLMIRREHVEGVRGAMVALGYTATNFSDGELLFRQFEFGKQDAFGVGHAFDFHWQVSTQSAFADLLTYDELAREAMAIPALGAGHARGAGPVHALLLACVHPAMHHQNVERLIWVHDVHLLLERMQAEDLERFAELAVRKGVAAICAQELARARRRLGTRVPEGVMRRLSAAAGEPTAVYLEPHRTWRDELVSNVGGLRRWSDRLRLLREVALPKPAYMLRAYGVTNRAVGTALLPALYLHRAARGAWKVLTGRK